MALTQINDRGLKTPIDLQDNEKIRFGTGNDLEIFHDGSHSRIKDVGTGGLLINASEFAVKSPIGENILRGVENDAAELYYDGVKKFETTSNGVSVTGNVLLPDSTDGNTGRFKSGTGADLQMYHDGTDSIIKNSEGDLFLRNHENGELKLQAKFGEASITCKPDAAVELYHDNVKKFETTATGVLTSGKMFVEQAGTDQTFLTLNADLGTVNNRELLFKGPSADHVDSPFRIDTGNALAFLCDGTESFRIQYNRAVGFGTTSPDERLHVGDDHKLKFKRALANTTGADTGDAAIRASILSSSAGAIHTRAGNAGNRRHFRLYNPNGVVGEIRTNGSGTTFATSSDYRLKENAVRISDGITRLKTLKPYKFNFKADPSVVLDGFFAHEATQIPEAVGGTKDEVVTQAMVDAGDYPESDLNNPIYQSIDHSRFVPLLTAALQDAVAKIEVLEAKVAALEAK